MKRISLIFALFPALAAPQWTIGGRGFAPTSFATYSDNFTRANGGLGANWTTIPASNCAPAIASDLVVASAPPCTHSMADYSAGAFANNQWSSVVVGATPVGSPLSTPTLALRCSGNNAYNDAYTGGATWQIGIVNPTPADFSTATANVAPVSGNTLELDVVGSSPVFFWSRLNGTVNAGAVDTTYLFTGGNAGVGVVEQNSTVTAKDGTWQGGSLPNLSATPADNFTRANAGWLGDNWWFPFHDDQGGGWQLSSDAAIFAVASTSSWDLAVWTTALNANHSSAVTVGNLAASGWAGAFVRYTPTNANATDNFYFAVENSGELTLYARSAGGWNQLGQWAHAFVSGDTYELDATGTNPVSLTIKINGSTFQTFSDSTYHIAGNYAGFAGLGSNATTVTGWTGANI